MYKANNSGKQFDPQQRLALCDTRTDTHMRLQSLIGIPNCFIALEKCACSPGNEHFLNVNLQMVSFFRVQPQSTARI